MNKESFGEWYAARMREEFGNRRVHVMSREIDPRNLQIGQYVMYLPLEITESLEIMPRLARCTKVEAENNGYTVQTELGIMFFKAGEKIQVVA